MEGDAPVNEWSTQDDGTGIWSLKSPSGEILTQIQHSGEEYVVLSSRQRLGKQWADAAKTAEDLSKPTATAIRGKKGR